MYVDRYHILVSLALIVVGIGAITMARKDRRYQDDPGYQRAIYVVVGILMIVGGLTLTAPVVRAPEQ